MVYVDPRLMRQAVANLVCNAAQYTPAGGSIDIELTRGERTVSCAVRDTGIGIPPEAQARLFEKFFRADNAVVMESEGTGLGLHMVHLVMGRFGGRVWCESEPGRGSVFTMELPFN
jgi:signal transduction histidine kinase